MPFVSFEDVIEQLAYVDDPDVVERAGTLTALKIALEMTRPRNWWGTGLDPKIVFGIASGILVLVAACLTCCCVLLPIVTQTALQPLFFFERAWSLFLLRQLGHDLIGPAAK